MPVITSIKPQKNNKRVNIYLDGEFGFGIDLENFVKLGLKVERNLTPEEVKKIVKEAEFQKVYDKILRFAALRPRSEKEFESWLKKHKVHESLREELFNRLKRLDFLNDRKFAAWWIEQRMQFRSKSKRELYQELLVKGIAKDLIEEVINDTKLDERQMAKKLLEKKRYKWEKLDDFTQRRKMSEFLQRHGFGWDVIKEIIKENSLED